MRLKKVVASCLAISLMSVSLVGCGSKDDDKTTKENGAEPTKAASQKQQMCP